MGVNLTKRPLGRSEIEYGGYSGTVRAWVEDHDLSHEDTPRYEVKIRLRGSDYACDRVEREVGEPVWKTERPSLLGVLRGEKSERRRRRLAPVVAAGLKQVFGEIDQIHASAGLSHDDEGKSAVQLAERLVEEWDYEEGDADA